MSSLTPVEDAARWPLLSHSRELEPLVPSSLCLRCSPRYACRQCTAIKKPFPISRFPADILLLVFEALRDSWPPCWTKSKDDPKPERHEILCWIVISHVCQKWRALSRSTSSLWSRMEPGPLSWARAFLSLSQTSPLAISFDTSDDQAVWWLLMLPHIPRAREITVEGNPGLASSFISQFREPAPNVRRLRVEFVATVSAQEHPFTNIRWDVNSSLLSERLMTLELKGRTQNNHLYAHYAFSLVDLVEVLRCVPQLQLLKIIDIPVSQGDNRTLEAALLDDSMAHLPRLRELHIDTSSVVSSGVFCNRLLRRLEFDPLSIRVRVVVHVASTSDWLTLLHSLVSCGTEHIQPLPAMKLEFSGIGRFHVFGWRSADGFQPRKSSILFSAEVHHPTNLFRRSPLGGSSPRSLHPWTLDSVRSLSVSAHPTTFTKRGVRCWWFHLLQKLPALECITLDSRRIHVKKAMEDLARTYCANADDPPKLFCPKLRILRIFDSADGQPKRSAEFYWALAHALDQRQQRDSKLEEITVDGEQLSREKLGDLETVVDPEPLLLGSGAAANSGHVMPDFALRLSLAGCPLYANYLMSTQHTGL